MPKIFEVAIASTIVFVIYTMLNIFFESFLKMSGIDIIFMGFVIVWCADKESDKKKIKNIGEFKNV